MTTHRVEENEYATLISGLALVDRGDRSLFEVHGKDRATWLHNLTTNAIKTLTPGQGTYAFALNLQGRILFDLNVFVFEDRFWIDLDKQFCESATKHFAKYTIVEEVRVVDRTAEFARFGIVYARGTEAVERMGAANAKALPLFGEARLRLGDVECRAFRTDFCGDWGLDLFVPVERACEVEALLCDQKPAIDARKISGEAVQVRRIERGIPWPGSEITSEYLPAETRQLSRAVSYLKGCYLGQEVVERMRSRAVVARLLVLVKMTGSDVPPSGAQLLGADGNVVGSVTSACHSIEHSCPLVLGYVKAAQAGDGSKLIVRWEGGETNGEVIPLPSAMSH